MHKHYHQNNSNNFNNMIEWVAKGTMKHYHKLCIDACKKSGSNANCIAECKKKHTNNNRRWRQGKNVHNMEMATAARKKTANRKRVQNVREATSRLMKNPEKKRSLFRRMMGFKGGKKRIGTQRGMQRGMQRGGGWMKRNSRSTRKNKKRPCSWML